MLTVKMSNFTNKNCFKPINLDKTQQLNPIKRAELFLDKNTGLETSFFTNETNPSGFKELFSHQSNLNSHVNQFFKVPNFDGLPLKKATVKSIKSPGRRVQTGRVKNDLKLNQQSKMSLIPRPSFINSRKSLHCSRSSQLNARKELIKKMVFLAESALKENVAIKQSTPVKTLAGMTPKKTPRSGGYFILPEFNKKVPKLEDIRSPIQDFIKKEMFAYSAKSPFVGSLNKASLSMKPDEEEISNFIQTTKKDVKNEFKNSPGKSVTTKTRFSSILNHCKIYNAEVSSIHEKMKVLDDSFENKLKNLPAYRVYNEFCFYQSKKEELYKELQNLEMDLRNFISTHTNIGSKLKAYVKKKQELFEKQINFQKDFEEAVSVVLETCKTNEGEKKIEDENYKVEAPRLRRSLRLSKMKKSKFEEKTPVTKKIKKLENKSKAIQKRGKV